MRAARTCVEVDPLDERWHRELIAAYARDGRTDRALRRYEKCRHSAGGRRRD
ncbi:MAG: BTAD domain-containing putative transcriptional regulator [Solirubrobacteraceae bacterium]